MSRRFCPCCGTSSCDSSCQAASDTIGISESGAGETYVTINLVDAQTYIRFLQPPVPMGCFVT